MKLLLDQNLSSRLVDRLAKSFPGSLHVRSVALERARIKAGETVVVFGAGQPVRDALHQRLERREVSGRAALLIR